MKRKKRDRTERKKLNVFKVLILTLLVHLGGLSHQASGASLWFWYMDPAGNKVWVSGPPGIHPEDVEMILTHQGSGIWQGTCYITVGSNFDVEMYARMKNRADSIGRNYEVTLNDAGSITLGPTRLGQIITVRATVRNPELEMLHAIYEVANIDILCKFPYYNKWIIILRFPMWIDPRPTSASLAFRELSNLIDIPGWDHVGLSVNNWVYESHRGYDPGEYYDPVADDKRPISTYIGVQWQHTLGSFRHCSTNPSSSQMVSFEEIPIDLGLAQKMAAAIRTKKEAGYIHWWEWPAIVFCPIVFPDLQKGANGTFSCHGLIEWAAEQVSDFHGGQGFIPDKYECLVLPGGSFSFFTPELLYRAAKNPDLFWESEDCIGGIVDPADFLLTDPLGRRLGYTEQLGLINEIPGAFYTGNGALEQFLILDPVPGEYVLEVFGLGDEAIAAMASSTDGSYFSGFLQQGQTITISTTVGPESVDDLVNLSVGRIAYDRRTGRFSVNATVTNTSNTVIGSPVLLVIESISSPEVNVANADGTIPDGKPYIDLSGLLGDEQLEPGESVTTRVCFNNPNRMRFTFESSVRGVISR